MTLNEFVRFHEQKGKYWFSRDTMRFFKSRVVNDSWCEDTGLFISSERGPTEISKRCYTIRKANFNTGDVATIGEFMEYATLYQARKALKNMLIKKD